MSGDAENKLRDQALAVAEAMRAFAEHTTDYSALLDSVVKTMATTVGGFCAIALPSEDSKWLEPVAMHDENPDALRLFKKLLATPVSLEGAHVTTRVYRTGEPSYTKEIDAAFLANRFSDPVDRKLAHDLFPRSQLVVAMRGCSRSCATEQAPKPSTTTTSAPRRRWPITPRSRSRTRDSSRR